MIMIMTMTMIMIMIMIMIIITIIIKLYLSVKPCSLGETHTNEGTQTYTTYKTCKTKISTLKYEEYKCSLKCFKDKAKH